MKNGDEIFIITGITQYSDGTRYSIEAYSNEKEAWNRAKELEKEQYYCDLDVTSCEFVK